MFVVHLPDMKITDISDKEALMASMAAVGASNRIHLLDYRPEEGKPPVVFFLFKGEAEKFVELCQQ